MSDHALTLKFEEFEKKVSDTFNMIFDQSEKDGNFMLSILEKVEKKHQEGIEIMRDIQKVFNEHEERIKKLENR